MSKMTDKQIKKALECCIKLNAEPRNFEICKKDCPYKFNCCDREKGISVEKDVLDLINRQQAEIERLNNLCQEQNTEVKRLIETKNRLLYNLKSVCEEKDQENIKSEAIKEYMKILEEKLSQNTDISNVGYQSIIFDMEQGYKKMVGEK